MVLLFLVSRWRDVDNSAVLYVNRKSDIGYSTVTYLVSRWRDVDNSTVADVLTV